MLRRKHSRFFNMPVFFVFSSLAAACLFATPLHAQSRAGDQLKEVQSKLKKSLTRKEDLEKEIVDVNAAMAQLREKLVASASRIQAREAQTSFVEDRLKKLNTEEKILRIRFAARRTILAELLAGLQRLEQNPPPALAVKPNDALSALRGALLLSNVVPRIRSEANALAQDLAKLSALRRNIASDQKKLKSNLQKLEAERLQVRSLLLSKRKTLRISEGEIQAERKLATKLAMEAISLKDLISKLGSATRVNMANFKASEAKIAALRKALRAQSAKQRPARPFSKTKGELNFPAQGMLLVNFGARDTIGGTNKGVSIATRKHAHVTTPVDGLVVYAGPFRSYGHLLIINAGEGYYILLAGMERINVSVGQFLISGEPIGIMGTNAKKSAILAGIENNGQPVLYIEFRKDGTSINPSPWWAGREKKARG